NRVVYRAIPYIYHKYPAQDDLYALFRNGFVLTERKLSSAIFQQNALPFRELRVRKIKLASQNELVIQYNTGLRDFWEILEGILWNKYNTRPVHTPEEMELLQAQFPQNIHLHTVCSNNCVLAGCVVYETSEVAHIQYIASNDEGKSMGALDLLFDYLINKLYIEKRYIDFGVSVEQGGWFLNEGLLFQKEGFGARSIVYDTYELEINRS
ncbi:GNAT family N-acetyltransferase, partial [Bacteroides sp. OttesenSCG-928-E20]|nr:GNAT family N-acetyltransferase [Bacteroides sp. OttesenSCG-928-E20]